MRMYKMYHRDAESSAEELKESLKMAKRGITKACELYEEMEEEFGDEFSERGGYSQRGGGNYSQRGGGGYSQRGGGYSQRGDDDDYDMYERRGGRR